MNVRLLNIVWIALTLATLLTWLVGKSGQAAPAMIVAVLGVSGFKGWLVVEDFMGLRRVKALWRFIMLGWLLLTLAVVLIAYWLGLP